MISVCEIKKCRMPRLYFEKRFYLLLQFCFKTKLLLGQQQLWWVESDVTFSHPLRHLAEPSGSSHSALADSPTPLTSSC